MAGMITNFNQQAAEQQVQINKLRQAHRLQQSMTGASGLDRAPSGEGMTRGQLRNNWYDAVGPTSQPVSRPYQDYGTAFGSAPYIQDFKSPAARDMMTTASMLISPLGGDKLSDSLLQPTNPATIKDLQKFLTSQGFDVGPAGCDGKLGPATHKALMKFIAAGQNSSHSAPITYGPGLQRNYQPVRSTQSMVC